MTKAQSDVILNSNFVEIVKLLLTQAKFAHSAIVSLPHVGEDGIKVIHRHNLNMIYIRDSYLAAASCFVRHIDIDTRLAIGLEFNCHSSFTEFKKAIDK